MTPSENKGIPPFSARSLIELCWGLTLNLSHEKQQQKLGANLKDHFIKLFETAKDQTEKSFLENLLMAMTKTLRNIGYIRDSSVNFLENTTKRLQDKAHQFDELSSFSSLSSTGLLTKIVAFLGVGSLATINGQNLVTSISLGIALATIGVPIILKLYKQVRYPKMERAVTNQLNSFWRKRFKKQMTDQLYELYLELDGLVDVYYPSYKTRPPEATGAKPEQDEEDMLTWDEERVRRFISEKILPPDDIIWATPFTTALSQLAAAS